MLKQTKFEDKTVKSTQLSLVPVGFRDFQIFPDRMALCEAWKWETYVWLQSFSSESAVKYLHIGGRKIQVNIPSPGRTRSAKCPTPESTETIKSSPHALLLT